MTEREIQELHAFISGRVQGVFFRQSTQHHAASLGLTGWVRNLPDGRVEVLAQGPRAALDQLLTYVHRGPPAARVDDVIVVWRERSEVLDRFEQR